MALPQTRDALEQLGYHYEGDGICSACGVPLIWFSTPNINPRTGRHHRLGFHIQKGTEDEESRILIPHFASCPNAADFRRRKGKKR